MTFTEMNIRKIQEDLKATRNRVLHRDCTEERIKYYESLLNRYKQAYPEYFV